MKKKKTLLSWSSGKDSSWTLYSLQQNPNVELLGLVTTINEVHQRVAMHAVRLALLEEQGKAAGLPLHLIKIPYPCSNEEYEGIMQNFIEGIKKQGIEQMAFGDLYLQDIRDYREKNLEGTGIAPLFPLWLEPTDQLAQKMIRSGLRAYVTCIDPKVLPESFAGREFNQSFLDDLPEGIDPCGENGEFHTFVFDGPMLKKPIDIQIGETVERDGFIFTDLTMKNTDG